MKKFAWFAGIVWLSSLWFLYPFPSQEIELVKNIQGADEGVGAEIWTRWLIVLSFVLLGIGFSVRFYFRRRFSSVSLATWSAIYLASVTLHFFRSSLAFEVSLPVAFIRQWESTSALQNQIAQFAFVHQYILLPVFHVLILLVLAVGRIRLRVHDQ